MYFQVIQQDSIKQLLICDASIKKLRYTPTKGLTLYKMVITI